MTILVAWAVTGKLAIAASIGVADSLAKLAAFYLHERIWVKIKFGLQKPPEFQI